MIEIFTMACTVYVAFGFIGFVLDILFTPRITSKGSKPHGNE